MLGMMVLLMADVFSRSIAISIQGMTELTVFVMMVVIYLGLARCEQYREHVRLEIIVNALPPSIKKFMEVFAYLLAFVTVGIFFYALAQNTWKSFQSGEALSGTVEIRIWPVKFIMLIGLAFYWIQTLFSVVDEVHELLNAQK